MSDNFKQLPKAYEAEICLLTNEKKQLNKRIKGLRLIFARYKKCKWYQFKRKEFFLNLIRKELDC